MLVEVCPLSQWQVSGLWDNTKGDIIECMRYLMKIARYLIDS